MQQYLKIPLLLSSIVCLLFSSCAISKYNHLRDCKTVAVNEAIAPVVFAGKPSKFKTTIDVLKNHLTGIVVVKQTDSLTTHIVFVTELGMKMFDFEVKGDSVNALYVFEPLNKPTIINVLKENFKNMLMFNLKEKLVKHCVDKTENHQCFSLIESKKTKIYLKASTGSKPIERQYFRYYPYLQETFNGKKRTSKINYVIFHGDGISYNKITAKQYGLVKFKFELINITE